MTTFNEIYKKHNRIVYHFFRKRIKDQMVCEELTADTMFKIHKSLHLYDGNISKLTTWIFNIAKNTLIDYFRKKKLNTISFDSVCIDWTNGNEESKIDHLSILSDTELNPLEKMVVKEVESTMYRNLKVLNDSEQLIASLRYFEGLSYEEIADQLSIPLGTVKGSLHRARKQLMKAFPMELQKHAVIA